MHYDPQVSQHIHVFLLVKLIAPMEHDNDQALQLQLYQLMHPLKLF
jgi:hypothetical protein